MRKLRDNIFNIGVKAGGVYNNAYLVKGEKTAVIDTVPAEFAGDLLKNIEEVCPVKNIDYLICNHSEPDKSGAVKRILRFNPNIEVTGTIGTIRNLKEITNMTFNEHIAKDGAKLDLGGGINLQFCITPNLNWPDTMVTYETRSKTLFSCDMFSSYYNAGDDMDLPIDEDETAVRKYYDKFLSPFKGFVNTAVNKISLFDIRLIAAGHGPTAEKYIDKIVSDYKKWSEEDNNDKKNVSIFFYSSYGSTAKMAETVAQTLKGEGFNVNLLNEINENTAGILNSSDALIFGTSTENKNMPELIRNALFKLDYIRVRGKPYFVFGSYGWSGEGIHFINDYLKLLKMNMFEKPFSVYFSPSDKDIEELIAYTKRFSGMIENI